MPQCFENFNFPNDGARKALGGDRGETYFFECDDALGGETNGLVDLTVGSFTYLFDAFIMCNRSCLRNTFLKVG